MSNVTIPSIVELPSSPPYKGETTGSMAVNQPSFQITDLPSIWSLESNMTWVVDNLIQESAITLLTGESGSGKSTLALAIAAAVARGEDFLGYATQKRDVVIVDKENGKRVYHERLKRLRIPQSPSLHIWGMWSVVPPMGPFSAPIVNFAKHHQPLIVFDSLIAFHHGSEQDSSDTRKYMNGFRQLAALGASVIVIHHTGKGENSKKYRGSSDIEASVDTAYLLTSKHDVSLESLTLTPFKQREGEARELAIKLVDGRFTLSAHNDWNVVREIIATTPELNSGQIVTRAMLKGVAKHRAESILAKGEGVDWSVEIKKGRAKCFTIMADQPKAA